MLVVSVCGVFRGKKYFYYASEMENANGEKFIRFNKDLDNAIIFKSLNSALTWSKEHYLELLKIMSSGSAKMLPYTLAVRKTVFKKIHDINDEVLNYGVTWGINYDDEVEENAEKEDTDALDEISNNGSESESGVEAEMSDNGVQTSSSDIQENAE